MTAVGDFAFQEKCQNAFKERQGRATVIMVSHSPATISKYCSSAAVLAAGQLTWYDTVEAAARAYRGEPQPA